MVNKALGYVSVIVGFIFVAITFKPLDTLVKSKLPFQFENIYFWVAGGVLILLGIFFLKGNIGNESSKGAEVPIYHGNKLIGYRRV